MSEGGDSERVAVFVLLLSFWLSRISVHIAKNGDLSIEVAVLVREHEAGIILDGYERLVIFPILTAFASPYCGSRRIVEGRSLRQVPAQPMNLISFASSVNHQ